VGEGASDDGAGCAIVIEAARAIAKYGPRRTVRVVLFAAEEIGGVGGAAYAKTHESELDKIVVTSEADAGEGRPLGLRMGVGPGHARDVQRFASLLTPFGVPLLEGDAHAGTDVAPLQAKGVPGFQVRQDMSAYFDIHHTKNDVFGHIDQESLTQTTAVYATLVYAATELDDDLGRAPPPKSHW